ncbi:hypothetical protein CROQUDRAFT_65091 [Cronartium quercuum f. sp. fusiforme G11]|uniref:RRM domain-containing protein n=1 Tax=Cronartium quercuum f. sp. fusiforme G11 TaxID=708437 RepID=A0A9P6NHY9_9BASI|nr:hypothetical protein CROQUDRAFT_65091 [Cronartium quercuum f. sp. fusiforme G11]
MSLSNSLSTGPETSSTQPYPSDASLFIGNLASDVTERDLIEIFSQASPVITARVCVDRFTKKSRGYGYVSYASSEDADLALREFNHWNIKGKTCRLMKSLSGSTKDFPVAANLFINHLPKEISAIAFHDTFEKFGKILSSKLALDHLGDSKGYGFIQYEKVEDAQKAMKETHLSTLDIQTESDNRPLQVIPFLKKEERKVLPKFTNVFFRNLPLEMTLENFTAFASQAGEVTSVILNPIRKPNAITKTGCANYKDSSVAIKVVEESSTANPRDIIATAAIKKSSLISKRAKSFFKTNFNHLSVSRRNLKIKPIPSHFTDADLAGSFSPYGNVVSAKVIKNPKAKSSYGFVCFKEPYSAELALKDDSSSQQQGFNWSIRRAARKPYHPRSRKEPFSVSPKPAPVDVTEIKKET